MGESRCNMTFLRITKGVFGLEIADPTDCPFRACDKGRADCIVKEYPKKREPPQCTFSKEFPKDCPLWDGVNMTVKVTKDN